MSRGLGDVYKRQALSSCTVETVSGGNNSSSGITLPDTWYNKDINWTDATSLNNLIIDDNGLVYSNKYMTEVIAILPDYGGSTITIPASVKTISGYNKVTTSTNGTTTKTATGAFEGLTSITKVVFAGKNVTQIGARAFYGCTGLQNITLPSSVTLVDTNAFYGCTSLSSINLDNVQYIGISAFQGAMTEVPSGSVSLNLNKTVLIGSSAFNGATGIGSIEFSKNTTLTQISDSAFSGCTGLSGNIDLSNATKLITIGSATAPSTTGSSFLNTAISNVYLPSTAGLRTIATLTFSGCKNLVTVGPKGTTGFKASGSVSGIYNKAFAGTKIASADISSISSSTPLYTGAFSGMTELASVSLGTTITTIPASCFMNCSALTSLTLPASITSISGGTPSFNNASTTSGSITFASETVYPAFYGTGLTSIDLSNITSYQTTSGSTLALPNTLFYNCASLESVVLKNGTTSIGQGSFAGTTALTSITTGSATKASEGYTAASDITTVGQFAFWQTGLSSVDLSAITNTSFTTLQNYTFTSCANLTTIKLPSTITTIASHTVRETPKLTTVNFGDLALSSIGDYNFLNCNLTEIDLTKTTISLFGDSTNNLFSGLSESTVVKLSPYVWNIASSTTFTYNQTTTSDDGTVTTTRVPINVTYPNGFAPTSTSGFSSGNLTAHTMFGRIGSSLDMSSFTALKSIGIRTFFNGPVTGLTFNASTFADGKFANYFGNTSAAQYGVLGFLGANTTDTTNNINNEFIYAATSLPFGNMTNLNTIKFNNFTSATSDTATSSSSTMAKTTEATWYEVARIMSSFGKEKTDNVPSATTNLTAWDEQQNVTATVTENNTTSLVESVTLSTTSGGATISINDSTTSGTITVAGVTWTIKVDATTGTITITSSSDVDTYRALLPATTAGTYDGSGYKVFFNKTKGTYTPSGGTTSTEVDIPNSSITVTLNVVAAATK